MAFSSGIAGTGPLSPNFVKATFTGKSEFVYTVGRDTLGYYFDFRKREQTERRRLPYYVGSGAAATAFLISVDGFLYESPVTWYSRTQAWDLSPGYENYSYPFLTRAIVPRCLECHASGVQSVVGTQNGYASPPFQEGGISCERCHGPGDAHVSSMRAKGPRTIGPGILNPARLAPALRDSICSQCHLSGDVVVEKAGKEHQPFVPGNDLRDYRAVFARVSEVSQTKVTSHVENLAQSKCKLASGDRLWCGTCHDSHSVPAPEKKAAFFRAKCQTCHEAGACAAKPAARLAAQDNCVSCHMPANQASDARHVVQTDHSIPRFLAARSARKPAPGSELAAFDRDQPANSRDLGLAYAILSAREQNAVYGERAFQLLKDAAVISPDDPQVLSYLADLYKKHLDDRDAERLYQRLSRVDPLESSAPVALGAYAMERGDYPAAIGFWTEALRKSPALLLVRVNLATALLRTGRGGDARAVLSKALEFNPGFTAAQALLDGIAKENKL